MPVTIFDMKGIPGPRRARIESAVVAGGKHATGSPRAIAAGSREAWIVADVFRPEFKIVLTGPHGFQRTVTCAMAEDPAEIAERVRVTLDELADLIANAAFRLAHNSGLSFF